MRRSPSWGANLRPADADIREPELSHILRPVDVAQIDDDRALEQGPDADQIEAAEDVPFGHDHEGIRALRWLPAAPARDVTITATPVPGDPAAPRVDVVIEGYARATVQLASSYPAPPAPSARPLASPRPSPKAPGPLYDEHWMFHGPAFQGVRAIDALGDDVNHSFLVLQRSVHDQ